MEYEKIQSFAIGSLFELIPEKDVREYVSGQIQEQTRGIRLCGQIQKIVLGLISTRAMTGKENQVVAVSVNIAKFISVENLKNG